MHIAQLRQSSKVLCNFTGLISCHCTIISVCQALGDTQNSTADNFLSACSMLLSLSSKICPLV